LAVNRESTALLAQAARGVPEHCNQGEVADGKFRF